MKNKFHAFLYFTATVLLLLNIASCSGIASPSEQESPSASRGLSLRGRFSLAEASAVPSEYQTATNAAQRGSRNAIPDTSSLTYSVSATNASSGNIVWATSANSTSYEFNGNLTAGTWEITAYAKQDTAVVLQSEPKTVTLSKLAMDASESLTMAPSTSGSGSIDLAINWASDSGIGYCNYSTPAGITITTTSGQPDRITANTIDSGIYTVTLSFYTSQANFNAGAAPLYKCTEYIAVYPDLTTNKWTTSTASHITSSGSFNVTLDSVHTFVYRKIYVDSASSSTNPNGTSEQPYKTIESAMTRLNEIAAKNIISISETSPWELHVTGTLTAPSGTGENFINVTPAIGHLKIVGEGSGATIDADSKGRVLNVQNGASVTIKDITLKKGSAVTGGGVCVASGGTFTMESGAISTCNASGAGGGIYSEGTLSIQEGSITGNNATGNSSSGGGIQVAGGSVSIAETGVTIQNNSSGAYGNNIFISSSATATIPTGDKALYDDNGGTNGKADTVCYASGNNFARFNKPHATNTQINAIISQFTGNATIYLGMTTSTPTPWKCNATDIASACTQNLTIKPTKTGTTTTIQYNGSSDTTDYLIHFNQSGKTLTLTNLILDGNSQKCGIAKLEAGTLTATNCTFQYGKAKSGGGLYVANGTTANLNSCTVKNCRAEKLDNTFGAGGGIYTWGRVNFSGTIQSCSVKGLGGGVYIGSGANAKFNMTEGTISNCSAEKETTTTLSTGNGGGVCVYGTFTMSDSTVTGCTAENSGIGAGAYLIAANAITPVLLMSGNACVGSNNEVYLDSSSKIKIVGNLNATVAAKIRLYTCLGNPQVLIDDSSGTKVASCYNKFTLSANGYCIDKDGIVKEGYLAETAPSHISSMTATGTVKVIGDISATTIANLNAALKTLYANNSSVRVTLDLSRTTGLTELPKNAFSGSDYTGDSCYALQGIVLPPGITKIGDQAFFKCNNLTSMVTIPPGVTEIGQDAFSYTNFSGTLNIPSSVRKFGYMTFANTPNSLTLQYEDTTSTWTKYKYNGTIVTAGDPDFSSTPFSGTCPSKDVISASSQGLTYITKN
ncbi:MAG: leucine-rich repeat protein [Treponema sp.]|nr:leucine-rich repeat protein [Treponema sp.]